MKRQENNLDLSEQDIVLTSGCCLLKRIMGNLGADAGPGGWELNILRKINIKDNGNVMNNGEILRKTGKYKG